MSLWYRMRTTFSMLHREAVIAGISLPELMVDVLLFCSRTGLGPRYYVVAGMARKGFPEDQKRRHISAGKYYRALEVLNPILYRKLTQSKVAEKALYQFIHVPTAGMLGYYHPSAGFDTGGGDLRSEAQLESLLLSNEGRRVCVKPEEGWGGVGVIVGEITVNQGEPCLRRYPSGQIVDVKQLLSLYQRAGQLAAFIVEDFLQQSDEFMNFNPDSLNTVRLWVLEAEMGEPQVIGAYLRVGREGSAIDNASAGGMMFPIDIHTGTILPGLTKHTPHRDDILEHPDHRRMIAGQQLTNWQAIMRFSESVVARLPQTRFAGLDVTMTPQGPVLVEANVAPDKDGAAHGNIPSLLIWQAAVKHHD